MKKEKVKLIILYLGLILLILISIVFTILNSSTKKIEDNIKLTKVRYH